MESQMAYSEMSDETKLEQAIKFIALGQPLPIVLETFLREADLYDLLTNKLDTHEGDILQV